VLLYLDQPYHADIARWEDRVRAIDARYEGTWELPAIGAITAPSAALVRPDGYVAWVGEGTDGGLLDALATWFGPRGPA
jgi:3-(3-hydroxy-phenyl)propionate hydroxylase